MAKAKMASKPLAKEQPAVKEKSQPMSYQSPVPFRGATVLWYASGDLQSDPVVCHVTGVDGCMTRLYIPSSGESRRCRHISDPHLDGRPEAREREGAWDYTKYQKVVDPEKLSGIDQFVTRREVQDTVNNLKDASSYILELKQRIELLESTVSQLRNDMIRMQGMGVASEDNTE